MAKARRSVKLEALLPKSVFWGIRQKNEYAPKTTRKEVGECSCGGKIIRVTKSSFEYLGDPMSRIIGPGGRNQLTQVVKRETFCKSCKLVYSNTLQAKKKAARSR